MEVEYLKQIVQALADNEAKLLVRIDALEQRIASLETQPKSEYKDPFVPEQVFHHPYLGPDNWKMPPVIT